MGLILSLAILAALVWYGIHIHNGLIGLRDEARRAWTNLDVRLGQRHDELLELVETCQPHAHGRQESLARVSKARSSVFQAAGRGDAAALGAAENLLRASLEPLFTAVENDLPPQAHESFRHLRSRIAQLATDIAEQRELYNAAVNLHNVRIHQAPDALVARLFGFGDLTLLEFTGGPLRKTNSASSFG